MRPIALAFEEREYTLPQLDALAGGMATTLEQRGVRAGDRVALMSSNRPEFVIALRAIWLLGAAAVLLSPAWKRAEVEHALALTQPAHAVGDHPVLAELMPMLHLDEPITPESRPVESPDSGADALFVFSSGTTGMPKAVRHTHASFAVAVRHWRDALQLSSADRMQIMTPPSHILGLLNIAMALETGAWIRLAPPVRHRPDAAPHRIRPDHHRDGRGAHRFGAGRPSGAGVLRPVVAAVRHVVRDAGDGERRRSRDGQGRGDLGDRLRRQRIAGDLVQPDRGRASRHRRPRGVRA